MQILSLSAGQMLAEPAVLQRGVVPVGEGKAGADQAVVGVARVLE